MSIWSTFDNWTVKGYEASHIDPRTPCGDDTEIFLSVVPDYVYDDEAKGEKILPWLRLTVGMDDALLSVEDATRLRDQLTWFIEKEKA